MAEIRIKGTGTIKLFENDNTSSVTIASPASLSADKTITLPDADVTLVSGTMNDATALSGTVPIGSGGTGATTLAGAGLANTPSFRAYMNANQTVNDVTNTVVAYNTESFDTDSAYNNSTYRFVCPSGGAGKYFFSAHAFLDDAGLSLYAADFQIRQNGTNAAQDNFSLDSSDAWSGAVKINTILDLAESDYVDVNVIGNTNDGTSFDLFTTSPFQFAVFFGYKLIG